MYYIRKVVFTVFVTSFLLAFGATLTSVYTLEKYESTATGADYGPAAGVTEPIESHGGKYRIAEHEGVIGVFDSSGELMYTVEVYVKTLPAGDRELLKIGIHANSYGEALEILGDYTA